MKTFERNEDKGLEALIICLGLPILLALIQIAFLPLALIYAWVDMQLWNWFGAPYFGLKPISLLGMYGITIFLSLQRSHAKKPDEGYLKHALMTILIHICAFATGYCLHLYLLRH